MFKPKTRYKNSTSCKLMRKPSVLKWIKHSANKAKISRRLLRLQQETPKLFVFNCTTNRTENQKIKRKGRSPVWAKTRIFRATSMFAALFVRGCTWGDFIFDAAQTVISRIAMSFSLSRRKFSCSRDVMCFCFSRN